MFSLAFDPEETRHGLKTRPRTINPEQPKKFQSYVADIFHAYGTNLDTPGTGSTPTLRELFGAMAATYA